MKKEINVYEIARHFDTILKELGLDVTDPNLKETPIRLTRMFLDFCKNHDELPLNVIKIFPNEPNYDEIILMDNIPFVSICSHHFLPFPGLAWFAYIPDKTLVGASKPARMTNFFALKPQLQEKLGIEIVNEFEKEIKPKGCMLVMRAIHGCMSCRGAKTGENAGLITSITRGSFRENASTRMEALDLIKLSVALRK